MIPHPEPIVYNYLCGNKDTVTEKFDRLSNSGWSGQRRWIGSKHRANLSVNLSIISPIQLQFNSKEKKVKPFIEETDDLPVASQAAVAPAPVQPVAVAQPIVSESCDDEFDASTVSTALPKVKVTSGQVCRVALLGPVVSGFRHFHEGTKSYIICLSERDPAHLAQITKLGSCSQSLP